MFRNISEGEYTSTIYGMIKEQKYSEAAAILQMEMPTIKSLLTETGGSCHCKHNQAHGRTAEHRIAHISPSMQYVCWSIILHLGTFRSLAKTRSGIDQSNNRKLVGERARLILIPDRPVHGT